MSCFSDSRCAATRGNGRGGDRGNCRKLTAGIAVAAAVAAAAAAEPGTGIPAAKELTLSSCSIVWSMATIRSADNTASSALAVPLSFRNVSCSGMFVMEHDPGMFVKEHDPGMVYFILYIYIYFFLLFYI
jgi:hypothetical protein